MYLFDSIQTHHLPISFLFFIVRLVEAGDWQGVVLAAAQFEGHSESDFGSKDGSDDQLLDDASEPSLLARGRSTKLESIRAEVELLVRRVVPDELG